MKSKKQVKSKAAMMLALVLVVGGLAAVAGSFLRQMLAEKDDMKEYAELLETAQQPADGGMAAQPETTDSPGAGGLPPGSGRESTGSGLARNQRRAGQSEADA